MILAIDPGNTMTAYAVIDEKTFIPDRFAKVDNQVLLDDIHAGMFDDCSIAVIEMIEHYGKTINAGKEVFDTCRWIGKFELELVRGVSPTPETVLMPRRRVKNHLCGTAQSKDSNVSRVLIDRFATHDFRLGKGTKDNPDFFRGFKADIWQAYALGVTYIDTELNKTTA